MNKSAKMDKDQPTRGESAPQHDPVKNEVVQADSSEGPAFVWHRKSSNTLVPDSDRDKETSNDVKLDSNNGEKSSDFQLLPGSCKPNINMAHAKRKSSSSKISEFSLETSEPGDLILDLGDQLVSCHKQILYKNSLYFQAMYESGMKESQSDFVDLGDINSEYFMCLLHYFYTGDLNLTLSNVQGVTELSSQFQVTSALDQCCKFLLTMIEDDLCLSLIRLSNLHMLSEVYNESRKHALWHFGTVRYTEDFFLAPFAQIVDYLQDPYLNRDNEVEVFAAAAEWYSAQEKPCDVTDLVDFFSTVVYFHFMTDEEVTSLQDLPAVTNDKELKAFVVSLSQDIITNLQTKNPSRMRASPRNGRILCIGAHICSSTCGDQEGCSVGKETTAPLDVVGFEPDSCCLQQFASLSDHYPAMALDAGYRVCAIGHLVYVVGGQTSLASSGGWLMTVWCLDTLRWSWQEAGQLQNRRRHHGMCAYGSILFLIGGIGRFRIRLDSVESYDTKACEWKTLPAMLHQETSPAVTVVNGKIYVFKNYAQVFNISTSCWSFLELSPPVPGLPLFAHPDPSTNGIFVTCFNSESLWLVDLDKNQSQEIVKFENKGGGGVFHHGCLYHFRLLEFESSGNVQVERYNTMDMTRSNILQASFYFTPNFVTVPLFPKFSPSSSNKLC